MKERDMIFKYHLGLCLCKRFLSSFQSSLSNDITETLNLRPVGVKIKDRRHLTIDCEVVAGLKNSLTH